MAENMGLGLGDKLTLISPDGDVTPLGMAPRVKSYPVTAIFEIGMSEYDASIVLMPLDESQLYFNQENKVQSIEIFADNPDNIDALKKPIEDAAQRSTHAHRLASAQSDVLLRPSG